MELEERRVLEQLSQKWELIITATANINLESTSKLMKKMITQWPQEHLAGMGQDAKQNSNLRTSDSQHDKYGHPSPTGKPKSTGNCMPEKSWLPENSANSHKNKKGGPDLHNVHQTEVRRKVGRWKEAEGLHGQ